MNYRKREPVCLLVNFSIYSMDPIVLHMKRLFVLLTSACISYSALSQGSGIDTTVPKNELHVASGTKTDSLANAADSLRLDKNVALCSARFTRANTWSLVGKNSTHPAINFNKINLEDYTHQAGNKKTWYTGFATQELYTLYPQTKKQNPWVVDYNRITPLLARAMQEQQKIIEGKKSQTELPKSKVDEVLMLITDFIRN